MAQSEVTGATAHELAEMRFEHKSTPLYEDHGIEFETCRCLTRIGKQPDDYDGPTRYCQKRVKKMEDYDGHRFDEEAYAPSCRFHGGAQGRHENTPTEQLPHPALARITHGMRAEDEHLRMDFDDDEQALYDGIVEQWPEVYDWPDESVDPARYVILRKVATNIVRSHRAEDYLDEEGEVRITDRYNDEGIVVEPDGEHEENPLAAEYRLLTREIIDMMGELGLTPKERQKMDTLEAEERQSDVVADIAQDALNEDQEFDPGDFEDDD